MPWRATGDTDLPIADTEVEWDNQAAADSVFDWADFDGDDPDTDRAARAFFAQNTDDPTLKGNYKLGFAAVVGGRLTAIPRGIFSVAGGRGVNAADLPGDVKDDIKAKVRRYYERMEMEPPASVRSKRRGAGPVEYKSNPVLTKQIEDRTVTGIFAVHGNIDEGGDRSHPGAFADVTVRGRNRVRFLWQHSPWDPPIAAINHIRELSQDELPPQVLDYAPAATGAVEVSRTYLNTPRADEVLEGIKADAVDEMSYGYEVGEADFEEDEETGLEVRNLRKVQLYDISDVLWGMNPATVGSKNWPWPVPLDFLRDPAADESALLDGMRFSEHSRLALAAVKELGARARNIYELRAKEGRVLSSANRKRIQSLVKSLRAVTADLEQLLDETDPEKAAKEARRLYAEFLHIESQLLTGAPS